MTVAGGGATRKPRLRGILLGLAARRGLAELHVGVLSLGVGRGRHALSDGRDGALGLADGLP